ncbi:MAG: hypothetical protein WEB58_17960 [Planctomycetaceae bacterium]
MPTDRAQVKDDLGPEMETILREVMGYLNFSNGSPDPAFQRNLNAMFAHWGENTWSILPDVLKDRVEKYRLQDAVFADNSQAIEVVRLVFSGLFPAYLAHHADLFFHLPPTEFQQPFMLARLFEAVLKQGGPWPETDRIVRQSLLQLNDYIGHRPVAMLENDRQMEPYAHERFRPIPLYLQGAGVAVGPYQTLITKTIEFLSQVPEELLNAAYFTPERLEELSLDPRAHDHLHPVNKRTNYIFGEWDPHLIDNQGFYRRFVLREIILQSLLNWINSHEDMGEEEALFDAAAVLSGTILMASSISGAGPDTHQSEITLTSLLPRVARQRDAFYARLMEMVSGAREKRLKRVVKSTQQPFGHVRQALNLELAHYGAQQLQSRTLAGLYARLGYPEISREEAARIPCLSVRFECDIQCCITTARQALDRGELHVAETLLQDIVDLLHRGIDCGALVDPWEILGFQGQFPLFSSREDSVPDQRVEILLELVQGTFDIYSRLMCEAAAQGRNELIESTSRRFRAIAEEWDRYASSTVEELPRVVGRECWESADKVSRVLLEWKAAGESADDISFWRQHSHELQTAQAYLQVVDILLKRREHKAALGLLMQWLSQAEEVGLEAGPVSFHALILRWGQLILGSDDVPAVVDDPWPILRKMFDYLEANAGEYWHAPLLQQLEQNGGNDRDVWNNSGEGEFDDQFDDEDDDGDDDLFEAAYDDIVFRDSAEDGVNESIMDSGERMSLTEIEVLQDRLEPRLRFLHTLTLLWQMAAGAYGSTRIVKVSEPEENISAEVDENRPDEDDASGGDVPSVQNREPDSSTVARESEIAEWMTVWYQRTLGLEKELLSLLQQLWKYEIPLPSGEHDANIEFDLQLQTRHYLLHATVSTAVSCRTSARMLAACLPSLDGQRIPPGTSQTMLAVFRGIFRRDPTEVRRLLPVLLKEFTHKALLYIPFDKGGYPKEILEARSLQAVMRFLLAQLPRLGLIRETWHLLKMAQRMERETRPDGLAVSEFDRLFRTALRNSLECIVESSASWKSGRFTDAELIEIVEDVLERYTEQWTRHSRTMRLSSVEALLLDDVWEQTKDFITLYGGEMLQAKRLTLGNVRAILHIGVEKFLEYLAENPDPINPVTLIDDIESGAADKESADETLSLIYDIIVDKFDRFLEYNTTTTQSDYGEMLYTFLDMLRLEAKYDRDAWSLMPGILCHEVFIRVARPSVISTWERMFEAQSRPLAERHLSELRHLERKYGMRLPSVGDHIQERFVKTLAVNRILALAPQVLADAKEGHGRSEHIKALQQEVTEYLNDTAGSSVDLPPWLRQLEHAVQQAEDILSLEIFGGDRDILLPPINVNLREMRLQLRTWTQSLLRRKRESD